MYTLDMNMFMQTLPIMGKAMLGIFAVTVAIIIVIAVLNKISSDSDKK